MPLEAAKGWLDQQLGRSREYAGPRFWEPGWKPSKPSDLKAWDPSWTRKRDDGTEVKGL